MNPNRIDSYAHGDSLSCRLPATSNILGKAIACGDSRAGLCPCCYGSSLFFNFQFKRLVLVADGASLIRPTVFDAFNTCTFNFDCVGWISAAPSTIGNTRYITTGSTRYIITATPNTSWVIRLYHHGGWRFAYPPYGFALRQF